MYAADENILADSEQSTNLLHISSAFGKLMETTNILRLVSRC